MSMSTARRISMSPLGGGEPSLRNAEPARSRLMTSDLVQFGRESMGNSASAVRRPHLLQIRPGIRARRSTRRRVGSIALAQLLNGRLFGRGAMTLWRGRWT